MGVIGGEILVSEIFAPGPFRTTVRPGPTLHPTERALVMAALTGWPAVACIAAVKGVAVDWPAFAASIIPSFFLIGLGVALRHGTRDRLALFCTATGTYVAIGGAITLLTYLRFPLTAPTIDPTLIGIDAMLGYHWPSVVDALAAHPMIWQVMAVDYNSALFQMLAVIAALAFSGQFARLHHFMATFALSLFITSTIWWIVPSFGAVAELASIFPVDGLTGTVIGEGFAEEMRRLAA